MAAPDYNAVNRGEGALQLTRDVYRDAMDSAPDKMYANTMENTDQAKGLLNPGTTGLETGLGRDQRAMGEAIRNKHSKLASVDDARLRFDMKTQAQNKNFEKLQVAADMVGQEQAMNYEKALAKYKQKLARKNARAAIVGQVLGIAGGIVGGIYGGPGGASAGYAAGNMVGTSVAGGGKT